MPIQKFKSLEEMKRGGTWRERDDPDLIRVIAALWDTGTRTAHLRFPAGVHKHKDAASMEAERLRWLRARALR